MQKLSNIKIGEIDVVKPDMGVINDLGIVNIENTSQKIITVF
jgi:hypothetical protein